MPHCFCRVLGRAILIFRIPPPSDTPVSGFSATILTTSPRSLSDKRPLGRREICRRLHDGLQAGAHNKNMGVNSAESRVPYARARPSPPTAADGNQSSRSQARSPSGSERSLVWHTNDRRRVTRLPTHLFDALAGRTHSHIGTLKVMC